MKQNSVFLSKFFLFFSVFLLLFIGKMIKAEAYDFSNSESRPVNSVFQTNISSGYHYDERVFKFTTPGNGYVQLHFSVPQQGHSDRTWDYNLYNSAYDKISEGYICGDDSEYYSLEYGFSAGDYYLCLSSPEYYNAISTDTISVEILFVSQEYWEREFNDGYNSADPIRTNTYYYGVTQSGYHYESDYFRFELDKPGYVQLEFNNYKNGTTDNIFKYYLINGTYDQIYEGNAYGNYEDNYSQKIGLAKGTYYFKVESPNYYYTKSTDCYSFRIIYKASDYWEREFNDNFNSADPIKLGANYYGSCFSGYHYESDYYRFQIPTGKIYRFTVNTVRQGDTSSYWNVTIYNTNYQEINEFTIYGNQTKTVRDMSLSPGEYYLRMQSSNYYTASTSTYSFNVSPKPVPSSLSVKKKKTSYYVGDKVNINDITVTAKFANGTTKDVTSSCIISNGVNTKKAGTYKITVSYEGKKASISIKVKVRPLKKGDKAKVKVGKTTFTYQLTSSSEVKLYSVSAGKKNLVKMTVPATVKLKKKTYKVTSIGSQAFNGCTNMKTLTIGKNVKSIGSSAVTGCKKLGTITVNTSKLTKKSVAGSLKGSYVKTVKVNKSDVSKYKKVFTKTNTKSRYKLTVKMIK